jgi:hypothetical protein
MPHNCGNRGLKAPHMPISSGPFLLISVLDPIFITNMEHSGAYPSQILCPLQYHPILQILLTSKD